MRTPRRPAPKRRSQAASRKIKSRKISAEENATAEMPARSMDVETQAQIRGVSAHTRAFSTGRATLTTLPENWEAERNEMLKRIDAFELQLKRLAPIVKEALRVSTPLKGRRESKRSRIGHNRPPEAIEYPPIEVPDLNAAAEATKILRSELNSDTPRFDVIQQCGRVLQVVGVAFSSFVATFVGQFGASAANNLLANDPQPHLSAIVDQIGSWISLLGLVQ